MRYGNHVWCTVSSNGKYIANHWDCQRCRLNIIDNKDMHWGWYIEDNFYEDISTYAITKFYEKNAPLTCEEVIMNEALQ